MKLTDSTRVKSWELTECRLFTRKNEIVNTTAKLSPMGLLYSRRPIAIKQFFHLRFTKNVTKLQRRNVTSSRIAATAAEVKNIKRAKTKQGVHYITLLFSSFFFVLFIINEVNKILFLFSFPARMFWQFFWFLYFFFLFQMKIPLLQGEKVKAAETKAKKKCLVAKQQKKI